MKQTPKCLVVVASEREGLGLVEKWNLQRAHNFTLKAGDYESGLGLYRGEFCNLLISGVLEHHMVAGVALAIRDSTPFCVVNFGACGTYENRFGASSGPRIEDSVCVTFSQRFDVDDNLHWVPPRQLTVSDIGLRFVTCVTGSRYSRESDYESPYFPNNGDVEDMELYGLAVLMETLGIPLYSIKYVTNSVGPMGRTQFRENVVTARASGQKALEILLNQILSK